MIPGDVLYDSEVLRADRFFAIARLVTNRARDPRSARILSKRDIELVDDRGGN